MVARNRFQRNPGGLGIDSKLRNRPRLDESPREFLWRLNALFGPPDYIDEEGFRYALRDEETGLEFSAYSGASGPAYGAVPALRASRQPVLKALDELLDATEPQQSSAGSSRSPSD